MTSARPLPAIPAKVYKGARKRYFSRSAAERSYFWAAIKRRCECEEPSHANDYNGYACAWHSGDQRDRIAALMRRYLRLHFSAGRLALQAQEKSE